MVGAAAHYYHMCSCVAARERLDITHALFSDEFLALTHSFCTSQSALHWPFYLFHLFSLPARALSSLLPAIASLYFVACSAGGSSDALLRQWTLGEIVTACAGGFNFC